MNSINSLEETNAAEQRQEGAFEQLGFQAKAKL